MITLIQTGQHYDNIDTNWTTYYDNVDTNWAVYYDSVDTNWACTVIMLIQTGQCAMIMLIQTLFFWLKIDLTSFHTKHVDHVWIIILYKAHDHIWIHHLHMSKILCLT